MPSGYEKSTDYGGKPVSTRGLVSGILVLAVGAAILAWLWLH